MTHLALEQVQAPLSRTAGQAEIHFPSSSLRASDRFDRVALTIEASNALHRCLRELVREQRSHAALARHLAMATDALSALAIVETHGIGGGV